MAHAPSLPPGVVPPPSTPVEVVQRLSQLVGDLKDLVEQLARFEMDAVVQRHAADIAEAKAYLSGSGSVDARRKHALLATQQQQLEADTAEALLRVCKARIRALETEIDVGRTYGATVRAELETLGYTGGRGR